MYQNKILEITNDIENKDIEIAGGAVVGINLATVNSLIIYICNLTLGKEKYADVEDKVKEIKEKAIKNKKAALNSIDEDKEILEEILSAYKKRKEEPDNYEIINVKSVQFALDVIKLAYNTKKLSEEISKVGNKMLSSDFNICKYYSEASILSAKENYYINAKGISNEDIKSNFEQELQKIEEE